MARGKGYGDVDIIVDDGIGPKLSFLVANVDDQVLQIAEEQAINLQTYAQDNAPWTDDTGAARAGLTATARKEDGDVVLELYHTVEHGKWLELIQDGRFAIILPTLEAMGEQVMLSMAQGVEPDRDGGFF